MKINRTKNTVSGTIVGVTLKIVQLVLPFLIRTIFIKTIGIEYLGLNSLFTSILQMLNLAELGVGSALVFSMYKPIALDQEEEICALLALYRRYYQIIGLAIFIIGLMIIPVLNLLVKGEIPPDINLYIIYTIHLLGTVSSYWFLSYRTCLFQAHQRNDVTSFISICVNLTSYGLQIVTLLLLQNYYIYLVIVVLAQIVINVVVAIYSKKYFPTLVPRGKLPKEKIKSINQKVRDLFIVKISEVVSNSFDTIVVSTCLGLTTLAIYQNYFYIVTAVAGMIAIFFASLQAGIGNFIITNNKEESCKLLYRLNYCTFFIINVCCCCLLNLYQPFMKIWVGEEYLLDYPMVIMYVLYLFAYISIRPTILFKDAAGMWKSDRFRPLVSSLVNLTCNILTVRYLGLYGVLGSTIISYLLISFPWSIINTNKYLFRLNIKKYLFKNFMYLIIIICNCVLTAYMSYIFSCGNTYTDLIGKLVISTVIPFVIFAVVFYKTDECSYVVCKVKGLLKHDLR